MHEISFVFFRLFRLALAACISLRDISHLSQREREREREREEIVRIRGRFSVQVQNITENGPIMTENKPKKYFSVQVQ